MKVKMLTAFVTRHPETNRPIAINPGETVDVPEALARRYCLGHRPIATPIDELPEAEEEDDEPVQQNDQQTDQQLDAEPESDPDPVTPAGVDQPDASDAEFQNLVDSVESDGETDGSEEAETGQQTPESPKQPDFPEILKLNVSERVHQLLIENKKFTIADVQAVEDLTELEGIGKTFARQILTALEELKGQS